MPIRPEMAALYPGGSIKSQLWQDIRAWVRLRSGDRCEGSPLYPDCRAINGEPHPVTGAKVVLTVAHVDHDLARNGPEDLRHWCQRCHNSHDVGHRAQNRRRTIEETTARLRVELMSGTAP